MKMNCLRRMKNKIYGKELTKSTKRGNNPGNLRFGGSSEFRLGSKMGTTAC
jgi:hypothetical protein